MRWLPCLAALALGLSVPQVAGAEEHDAPHQAPHMHSMHASPHTAESSWILGAKFVQLNAFPDGGESSSGAGAGVFGESTLIHGWLELELSASIVSIKDETIVPVDVLLKKPFHFGKIFCPYFSLGPTVSFVFEEDETTPYFGVAAVVGTYLWFNDSFGLDLEIDYAVLDEGELVQEITFAGGPTVRF